MLRATTSGAAIRWIGPSARQRAPRRSNSRSVRAWWPKARKNSRVRAGGAPAPGGQVRNSHRCTGTKPSPARAQAGAPHQGVAGLDTSSSTCPPTSISHQARASSCISEKALAWCAAARARSRRATTQPAGSARATNTAWRSCTPPALASRPTAASCAINPSKARAPRNGASANSTSAPNSIGTTWRMRRGVLNTSSSAIGPSSTVASWNQASRFSHWSAPGAPPRSSRSTRDSRVVSSAPASMPSTAMPSVRCHCQPRDSASTGQASCAITVASSASFDRLSGSPLAASHTAATGNAASSALASQAASKLRSKRRSKASQGAGSPAGAITGDAAGNASDIAAGDADAGTGSATPLSCMPASTRRA